LQGGLLAFAVFAQFKTAGKQLSTPVMFGHPIAFPPAHPRRGRSGTRRYYGGGRLANLLSFQESRHKKKQKNLIFFERPKPVRNCAPRAKLRRPRVAGICEFPQSAIALHFSAH
jgi:hypothetical protein